MLVSELIEVLKTMPQSLYARIVYDCGFGNHEIDKVRIQDGDVEIGNKYDMGEDK